MHNPLSQSAWPEKTASPDSAAESTEGRIRARAFVIAAVLTALCGIWVRQAEIVVLSTQITESVPPIPALAVLLLLIGLNPLLRLLGRRFALTRAEMLAIYCFVAIAISILGVGVVRFWLALLTHPFYFATASNQFATLFPAFPSWLAVKDPRAIHDLYLRSATGRVPWSVWIGPLAAWTAFFMALWLCMLCMMLIVRRRWIDSERLTFPIVALPVEIASDTGRKGGPAFLRDRMMWAGFGLAAAYNLWNIAQAMVPSLPAPGKLLDLTPVLENTSFRGLNPLEFWYRPELIGFGILVPSEILFSIWFFYVLSKVEGLIAAQQAADIPGMPFEQEQSIGCFLLLGLWLLWQARGDIFGLLRKTGERRDDDPPRWATPAMFGSLLFLCLFCVAAGMKAWVAAAYLLVVLITALVVARIRAEAGVPLIWLFPFYQQKKILLYTLGSAAFMGGAVPTTLVIFALLTFLSRGYFPSLIGYQIESLKIAEESRISRKRMCLVILAAALVGFVVAYYFHLTPYYRYGAQNLRDGIWGTGMARQEYTDVVNYVSTPQRPDVYRTGASIVGALLTAGMLLLRRTFVGFPLHPVGYGVATAYGSLVWWPFLLTWVAKTLILRYGGMRAYRRAVPFFLGFALGHFFVAGAIWGLLGAWWQEGARAYPVWFG